jgi:hypothetical protein
VVFRGNGTQPSGDLPLMTTGVPNPRTREP